MMDNHGLVRMDENVFLGIGTDGRCGGGVSVILESGVDVDDDRKLIDLDGSYGAVESEVP